ncbi:MAG: GNAT family N-acetyltransferase [Planctomycetales bacterium]|nr:GNAT family N-acetyltransferase [Planctomycetales bacterium]
MSIDVVDLDFQNSNQVDQFLAILQSYALEDGAGAVGIPQDVQDRLPALLDAFPTRHVLLAVENGVAIGVAVCFCGFSTFKARPVLNIHDLAVLPAHRGKKVGTTLLNAAKQRATELGCSKVTLEVIETNEAARRLYEREGFRNPTDSSPSLFLEHHLP